MRYLASALVLVGLWASPLQAADDIHGTWKSATGTTPQTFIFKVKGDTFTGLTCGPCDDPAFVFRIEDGKVLDAGRATFTIRYDVGGPLFAKTGPYRAHVTATFAATESPLGATSAANTIALTRVVADGQSGAKMLLTFTSTPLPASAKPSPTEGHWVSNGRVHQQNFILKVRDNKIWGLVCGPCNPDGVFMIDDGTVEGDNLTFYINHIDTPPSATRTRINRNVMKGTRIQNVMKFHWVREGAEDQPGGDMVLIGPVRE